MSCCAAAVQPWKYCGLPGVTEQALQSPRYSTTTMLASALAFNVAVSCAMIPGSSSPEPGFVASTTWACRPWTANAGPILGAACERSESPSRSTFLVPASGPTSGHGRARPHPASASATSTAITVTRAHPRRARRTPAAPICKQVTCGPTTSETTCLCSLRSVPSPRTPRRGGHIALVFDTVDGLIAEHGAPATS